MAMIFEYLDTVSRSGITLLNGRVLDSHCLAPGGSV